MKESPSITERIREVCRYIERHFEEPLTIEQLASMASMSRFHFARSFRTITGVTPKEYLKLVRHTRALKDGLRTSGDVDSAHMTRGMARRARVYESAAQRLGMTLGHNRRGCEGKEILCVWAL